MISKETLHTFKSKDRILLHTKEFICLLPHPLLRAYISNYNITFPSKTLMSDSFTIMPCGCATISIEKANNSLYVGLDGPVTLPYLAGKEASQLDMMISIEFRPAGLYAITGISQNQLTNKSFPLDAISPAFTKSIADSIEKSASISDLVSELDTIFITHNHTAYRPELMMALHDIKASTGNISIKQLSENTHYSQRHLSRIFNQFVGTSAKSFSRIIRINSSFRLLKKPHANLAHVSDIAGFHDLSHFIHDFKLVCGVTPQEYCRNMSDFYSNPTRF